MKDSTNGVKDIHMLFTRSKIKGEFLCKERQERQEQCTFWPCESLFGFILLVLLEESPIQKSSEKSTLIFESKKKENQKQHPRNSSHLEGQGTILSAPTVASLGSGLRFIAMTTQLIEVDPEGSVPYRLVVLALQEMEVTCKPCRAANRNGKADSFSFGGFRIRLGNWMANNLGR